MNTNLEIRLTYTEEGIPITCQHARISDVWDVDYIVVDEAASLAVNPDKWRVVNNELVYYDPVENVYWRRTPALTIDNNPFFCIEEIEDAN